MFFQSILPISMDSTLVEPQINQKFKYFIGQNYQNALNRTLEDLLDSLQNPNFEKFTSDFRELLHCKIDPPLETIWVYAALVFHSSNLAKNEPLSNFSAIKDLFQLIISYSASCDSLKSIVLIAPVIYNFHKFVRGFKGFELGSKKEKKMWREIKGLADSILGYINVCCEGLVGNFDGLECLLRPLEDLVSFWIWNEKVESEGGKERLKLFFPLLGEGTVENFSVGRCGLNELAGHVIAEAFLLKLCLAFRGESYGKEMQNELRTSAVGSATGLRNSYFFDSLVRMLLEPSLPVTSLLSSEDEISLRKLLYDTVVLVEYSSLNPKRSDQIPAKHVKIIALGRLMVTHEAVEFFRERGDQTKVLSIINAFSSSSLPSELLKLVRSEIGIDANANANGPNGSSPKAFLRWILNIENRGIKIFDDEMSRYCAKLVIDNTEEDSKLSAYREDKQSDMDLLFYIDNKGEQEDENKKDENMTEALSAALVAAAHSLQSGEHGGRKRKAENNEKKRGPKFSKYKVCNDTDLSGEKPSLISNDGSSSGSEVENPSSDEE